MLQEIRIGCCEAIAQSTRKPLEYIPRFCALFSDRADGIISYWWGNPTARNATPRVLALLLMAEIIEDENRSAA